MNEFLLQIAAALAGTGVAAALLTWLAGKWIGTRIDASIKEEYDRRKLEREAEVRRRERAQLVAELMAEWMATPLDGNMSNEQRTRINRLSFEATLWLPEEIALELSRVLQHDPTAPNQFELLLSVRTHLSGPHGLTIKHVTQWSRDRELPNLGLPKGFKDGQITVADAQIEQGDGPVAIPFPETGLPYVVPDGVVVALKFLKGEAPVLIKTSNIRALRLIDKGEAGEEGAILTLEVFPKDLANNMNRTLFFAPDRVEKSSNQTDMSISETT